MKQLISRLFAVAGSMLLVANAASASGNLEKAAQMLDQQSRAGKGEFITYLTGAAAAYRWAGGGKDIGEARSIYCAPADAKLDGRGYAKIALQEYQRKKGEYASVQDFPLNVLALALMRGLQEKFPCAAERQVPAENPAGDQSPK
jgi:hypothetical protein